MITFCRNCNKPMVMVYHFEEGKSTNYYMCKDCYYTSKPKNIDFNNTFNKENKIDSCNNREDNSKEHNNKFKNTKEVKRNPLAHKKNKNLTGRGRRNGK